MTVYKSGGRDRTYQVLMYALLEEKSLGLLTQTQFDERHKEIIDSCYHDDPPAFWEVPVLGSISARLNRKRS